MNDPESPERIGTESRIINFRSLLCRKCEFPAASGPAPQKWRTRDMRYSFKTLFIRIFTLDPLKGRALDARTHSPTRSKGGSFRQRKLQQKRRCVCHRMGSWVQRASGCNSLVEKGWLRLVFSKTADSIGWLEMGTWVHLWTDATCQQRRLFTVSVPPSVLCALRRISTALISRTSALFCSSATHIRSAQSLNAQ